MAYFDTKSGSLEEAIRQAVGGQKIEEKMDAVNKTAVKKKFDDRKDKDIDNDGDVDSSDKFLHKRRKAISKAMSKDEGNKFTGALNAAREKGEKTFVVSGKTYNVEDYQKEELELTEAKISKELAIKILSMRKDKKFVKVSGDFVPKIYLSGNDKDALKKEFGKLPRGLPSATSGMSVVSMINYALGSKDGRDPIDTEDGDSQSPKLISWNRGGKVIGKPRTVGDAVKIAGVRMESVDLDEGKMKELAMKIASVYTKMKKDKQMKPFADKFRADVKTSMNIKKSLEKVLPDYVGGGDITKLMGENFIGTPETTKARLDATPGQSSDDWNEQVGVMQKKNDSMREALAKMWGVEEGHNPFKKEEKTSKKEGKTMTGKPETKVTIDPDMKEKVKTETAIGKKNIK